MKKSPLFERFRKNLPSLISAFLLAVVVWVLAVTNTDPVQKRNFGRPVPIEIFGLNSALVITSDVPEQISLSLSAPVSTWESELTSSNVIRAVADLSGLGPGTHSVPVNLQINAQPVKVESYSPDVIDIEIEEIYSESFTIDLIQPSSPAIGYEAGSPTLSQETATVNGPASLVDQVVGVQALLDISQAKDDIDTNLELKAFDENGLTVTGVTIFPADVNVKMDITQRGGYRTVSVKVVSSGQVASGYDLTAISYDPLVVTVFSTNPDLVNELPGFIETQPLNLNNASENMVVSLPLNLPAGMTVVGESTIKVSVTISPIQGSRTLTNLSVEIIGLDPNLSAQLSPEGVDIILSGPLPTLDELIPGNVRIFIDLTGYEEGIYQLEPSREINIQGVLVQSLLPATIEVEILPLAENPE
ncbi:MAG: CdaR family protein [Pelolinea sp.]|nr:CdaR family protein [Pelolinea sp.]